MIVITKIAARPFRSAYSLLRDTGPDEYGAALALTDVLFYITGILNKALSSQLAGLMISTLVAGYGPLRSLRMLVGRATDNATHPLIACAERPHIVARLTTFESVKRNVTTAFL